MRRGLAVLILAGACGDYGENDAPSEPPRDDGGATNDAAEEDGVMTVGDAGVDVVTPPFCPDAGGLFCADFDRVATLNEGFTTLLVSNGSTGVLDRTMSTSTPASALFTVPADAGPCTFAQLTRDLPGGYLRANVSFSVRVDLDATESPLLAAVGIADTCGILVAPSGDGKYARVYYDLNNATGESITLARSLARAKWERVTVVVSVGDTPGLPALRVLFGSEVVLQRDTLPVACNKAGIVRVRVGPHCVETRPVATQARFDDVLVFAD